MITKITKEQEAKISDYYQTYLNIGLSTEPCDRPKAEAALIAAHAALNLPPNPTIIWADNPKEGAKIAAQLAAGSENVTPDQIKEQAYLASYGSFEAYWVSFYSFVSEQLLDKPTELATIAKNIVLNCGVYWEFEDVIVVTEKPIAIYKDNDGKLHNETNFALEYKGGFGLIAINGVRYDSLLDKIIALSAK